MLGNTSRCRLALFSGAMVVIFTGMPALAQDAQQPIPPPAPEGAQQVPGEAAPVPETDAPPVVAPPAPAPAPAAEPSAEVKALLEAQQRQIDELEARLDDLQAARDDVAEVEDDKLKIYGFTDFGLQRIFAKDTFSAVTDTKASFVIGNLNVYFDAQPIERWRTLFEIRFTNAPNGNLVVTPTGSTGRTSTFQADPHAGVWNAPMWGGYTVIERAHTDYLASQYFNVRVGNFFTPIGIWNVDHGSPVLIPVTPPQIILQRFYPIRQTGLQFYGSAFAGPWELGYVLTLTNGRQELSNFDFDDDKAVGGRLFALNEGDIRTQIGVSAYYGNAEDRVVSFTPAGLPTGGSTWEYDEYVVGADFSLDAGGTRIRAEALMQRQVYEPGKRENSILSPGAKAADGYRSSAYLIAAQQLPFLGLEPYLLLEGVRAPNTPADTVGVISGGLNVHFSPVTQLKLQAVRVWFWNQRDDPRSASDIPEGEFDHTILTSRLVVAF